MAKMMVLGSSGKSNSDSEKKKGKVPDRVNRVGTGLRDAAIVFWAERNRTVPAF